MDRSKIGQIFKDTFKKDDSNTPVKSGEIVNFIFYFSIYWVLVSFN